MEGFLCNWKLGVATLSKYWENTKGVHHFKKNSIYQKMEVYVDISIFFFFFFRTPSVARDIDDKSNDGHEPSTASIRAAENSTDSLTIWTSKCG